MQSLLKMETDSLSIENQECKSNHARFYECTFCKRGFSNAQALGGHMNIHRKDRAKLKQPSKEDKFALDINKEIPLYSPINSIYAHPRSCTLKWPWVIPREVGHIEEDGTSVGKYRQLPLFMDTPAGVQAQKRVSDGVCDEGTTHWNPNPVREVVDLELRLSLEPKDMSLDFKEFL